MVLPKRHGGQRVRGLRKFRARVARSLPRLPLAGWPALVCGIVAVSVPTAVKASVHGLVTGCEFTPYLPFVLFCAILLRWWQAGAIAIGAVAIVAALGDPTGPMERSCFVTSSAIFLASSALIIGMVLLVKWIIPMRGTDESRGGIVFSLDRGAVWASWYGEGRPIRLGSRRKVSEMMKDFLAQEELAKRLNNRL